MALDGALGSPSLRRWTLWKFDNKLQSLPLFDSLFRIVKLHCDSQGCWPWSVIVADRNGSSGLHIQSLKEWLVAVEAKDCRVDLDWSRGAKRTEIRNRRSHCSFDNGWHDKRSFWNRIQNFRQCPHATRFICKTLKIRKSIPLRRNKWVRDNS